MFGQGQELVAGGDILGNLNRRAIGVDEMDAGGQPPRAGRGKDWIRARLTGEFHAEPSDASATLLYDVPGDRWDLEAVSGLGLDWRSKPSGISVLVMRCSIP